MDEELELPARRLHFFLAVPMRDALMSTMVKALVIGGASALVKEELGVEEEDQDVAQVELESGPV